MREENKIPLNEVHRLLNERIGETYPDTLFLDLFWCWKKKTGRKDAGKLGYLSRRYTEEFLRYAY